MGGDSQQHRRDPGDPALIEAWFPRPAKPDDIELLGDHGSWTRERLFRLIIDRSAVEWREKVGVAGPVDGSAKATTRLLATGGLVLKTRADAATHDLDTLRREIAERRSTGEHAALWHPEKAWGLLRRPEGAYPFTACPELRTLRSAMGLPRRMSDWLAMLERGIEVFREHGLGLDLNPANFGRASDDEALYYVDDEWYPALFARDLAVAMVARIPEEPHAEEAAWSWWGRRIRARLEPAPLRWDDVYHEVGDTPVATRFEERRTALLDGLSSRRRTAKVRRSRLTCVLADVHGNAEALDAVLADARAQGVEDFVFLGDAVGYGPHPEECVRRLAELPRLTAIRGNHDHSIATGTLEQGMNSLARECASWTRDRLGPKELAWLASLPIEYVDDGWIAVHGAPRDPRRFLAYVYDLTYEENLECLRRDAVSLCFHGHSHVQLVHVGLLAGSIKLAGEKTVPLEAGRRYLVNPGSVGQPRDGDARAAYALWDRSAGSIALRRVAYDLDATIAAITAAGLPERLSARLRTGS